MTSIEVYCRMQEMEKASEKNPNLMQTYEVMWKALKKEILKGNLEKNVILKQQLKQVIDDLEFTTKNIKRIIK